ncbi:winged helix-turn-helix domain-containing protein [Luteimicrobium sp. DT211]|uniref:winged helix-turn-helix domain-containing protein n=1 Tax=Luteimicrobium sp. DT211 TaxID=3393412 RepID=UPI003CF88F4A
MTESPRTVRPSQESLTTGDPAMLRALAHPLRIEILAILDEVGEATASEVAARTGQTVANCSFHLRSLEKAGYVERSEPRGREKPWRPAHRKRKIEPDPDDAAAVRQSGVISAGYVQHEATRLSDFLTDPRPLPPEWVRAVTVTTAGLWVTAEEMEQLGDDVLALIEKFSGRGADPSLRPEGAVHGHMLLTLNPDRDAI